MGPSSDDDHQPLGLSSTRPQLLLSVATHAESPPHVHPSIPQIRSLHRGGLMRLLVWMAEDTVSHGERPKHHQPPDHKAMGQKTIRQEMTTMKRNRRDNSSTAEASSSVHSPVCSSVKASRLDLYVVSTRVMNRQRIISHQTRIVCAR